ncbi:hypothetical protein [Shewanella sp.]|uniref:hypothetical protein n=1 Tax=Shewanella sp. TaxID=50422 RepID=UPI003562C434
MSSVECLELSLLSKPELCDDLFAPSLSLRYLPIAAKLQSAIAGGLAARFVFTLPATMAGGASMC